MAFQLKDFASIVAGMLNHLRGTSSQVTDFNVGSVARSLVEAPAREIDELYQQMFTGLREAIPVAVFKTFDFEKLPAEYASGLVTFTASPVAASGIIIPAGTAVRVPGTKILYKTQSQALLPPATPGVNVTVVADTIGVAGNIAANTATELVGNISGITSVTNGTVFSNGRDVESDGDRKIRFQAYISTLSRGTIAAIQYGARTAVIQNADGLITEAVAQAVVIEPYLTDNTKPPAIISCRIHNGVGSTSAALVAAAQLIVNGYSLADGTIVPGWKSAGVVCTVIAAGETPVLITGALTVQKNVDGPSVAAAVLAAANNYVLALPIGGKVVLSEIIAVIMSVAGVYNIQLTSPAADIAVANTNKAMPSGSSALTWVTLS